MISFLQAYLAPGLTASVKPCSFLIFVNSRNLCTLTNSCADDLTPANTNAILKTMLEECAWLAKKVALHAAKPVLEPKLTQIGLDWFVPPPAANQ